jgi:glucokinase
MLLAVDIGGTKTLLGLFERSFPRPVPHTVRSYATNSYTKFTEILDAFAADLRERSPVEAAAVGVAGPVLADRATLTNVNMDIATADVAVRFGARKVMLLNDLEAMASAVDVLTDEELVPLQRGLPRDSGNAAVIAAGTGLGEAFLHREGAQLVPIATESGHADFAARTDRELELVRMLRERYGRAEVEHVISGPGVVNLHRFTHRGGECQVVVDVAAADAPAQITQAAFGGRCQGCAEALRMFVSAYGAEAGNLALRGMATSGVYIGGGIARKILPALENGSFMEAFLAKGALRSLLLNIPVRVIVRDEAALLGAAVCAQRL